MVVVLRLKFEAGGLEAGIKYHKTYKKVTNIIRILIIFLFSICWMECFESRVTFSAFLFVSNYSLKSSSTLRRVVCSVSASGQRHFKQEFVLCCSKDFFWDTCYGLGWPAQHCTLTPPSKPQKLQMSRFNPLALLNSVPHLHIILWFFRGCALHGWWLSGKIA